MTPQSKLWHRGVRPPVLPPVFTRTSRSGNAPISKCLLHHHRSHVAWLDIYSQTHTLRFYLCEDLCAANCPRPRSFSHFSEVTINHSVGKAASVRCDEGKEGLHKQQKYKEGMRGRGESGGEGPVRQGAGGPDNQQKHPMLTDL